MKTFEIGTKVTFIFTNQKGTIKQLLGTEWALVQLDAHPFNTEKVELKFLHIQNTAPQNINPYANFKEAITPLQADATQQVKAINATVKKEHLIDNETDSGIKLYLQPFFEPETTDLGETLYNIDYLLIFIHNCTPRALNFKYTMTENNGFDYVFDFSKNLISQEHVIVNSIQYTDLNNSLEIAIQGSILNPEKYPHLEPTFAKKIKLRIKNILAEKQYVPILQADCFVLTVIPQLEPKKQPEPLQIPTATPNNEPQKLEYWQLVLSHQQEQQKLKQSHFDEEVKIVDTPEVAQKIQINTQVREIDLHIEKLQKNFAHLRNSDIVHLQLKYFQENMEKAIRAKEYKMIVIHGIGKGKLKQDIIALLRHYPQVKTFRNDLHPKYGYGATEIFFEY